MKKEKLTNKQKVVEQDEIMFYLVYLTMSGKTAGTH